MRPAADKIAIARELQSQIDALQGLGKVSHEAACAGLSPFTAAFPGNVFPKAAVHEFISYEAPGEAVTNAFIASLTGKLMREGGLCVWIGGRKLFPAGLKHFGLEPDRVVFIAVPRPKEALWVIEEALKCEALTAVIGEMRELSFTDSRRLQLAVENSGVTAFIHRYCPRQENTVACTTRWKITPIPSRTEDHLPGVGYPAWDIQLVKVRNGRPKGWQVNWLGNRFVPIVAPHFSITANNERQTG